jgi:hypothetical protein
MSGGTGVGAPPTHVVPRGALLQHISWAQHAGAPLYFGRARSNRYDAPDGAYGVLYVAEQLDTCLMESVFHKNEWATGGLRQITLSRVEQTIVRFIQPQRDLRLFDLSSHGAATRHFGMNLHELTTRDYAALQGISQHIEAMDAGMPGLRFDGLRYPSRNLTGAHCIALFDRSALHGTPDALLHELQWLADVPLWRHRDWPAFVGDYGIGVSRP